MKKTCYLLYMAILAVALLAVQAGPLPAQDGEPVEDPFAEAYEESGEQDSQPVEDPFASSEEEESPFADGEDPFAAPGDSGSQAQPEGESPFADADDPFATSQEDPFAADTSEEEAQNPFEFEQDNQAPNDPFAVGEEASPFEDIGQSAPATPAIKADDPFAVDDPFAATQQTAPSTTRPVAVKADAANIRGLYVIATAPGLQTGELLQNLAQEFRAADFNRLYPEVRTSLGVAYNSDIEPSLPFITPGYSDPVGELRRLLPDDAKVIAVISLLPSYNAITGSRPPESNPLGRNPGLINQRLDRELIAPDNAIYVDPGNPEARAYLQNLLREIDSKVRPDGYLFRGVKYPGRDWGYSERAIQSFRSAVGGEGPPPPDDPVWSAWRRAQLSTLLAETRQTLNSMRPGLPIGVVIDTHSAPPRSWGEWVTSRTYTDNMQDWIGWCQNGLVDEVVLEVHERVRAQGNTVSAWVDFANNNSYDALPIVSLAGGKNFTSGFVTQFSEVRQRGVGTILYHYADPVRGNSRGFFESLPNLVFGNAPGRPVPGRSLAGEAEVRIFARLSDPPGSVTRGEPTPTPVVVALEEPLVFSTPTPIPTPVPEAVEAPDDILRKITLSSGLEMEAVVLEVRGSSITLQQPNRSPIQISRTMVTQIQPPL